MRAYEINQMVNAIKRQDWATALEIFFNLSELNPIEISIVGKLLTADELATFITKCILERIRLNSMQEIA